MRAASRDIAVTHSLLAESVALRKRSVLQLSRAFMASGAPLNDIVASTNSAPLNEARREADTGLTRYALGVLRASNLAIAHALSGDGFIERVVQGLGSQPAMRATIAWGTESELTTNDEQTYAVKYLQRRFGVSRVAGMAMYGMPHAGGDDIDLFAAMTLQALSR